MKYFRFLPFTALSLALAGITSLSACSTNQNNHVTPSLANIIADQTGQDGRACIRTHNIRGYAVNRKLINIRTTNKFYVAETLYQCHDLELAPRALFDSRFTEACGGSSYIITRTTRCPIQRIYEFENRKEAFAVLEEARNHQDALKETEKAE